MSHLSPYHPDFIGPREPAEQALIRDYYRDTRDVSFDNLAGELEDIIDDLALAGKREALVDLLGYAQLDDVDPGLDEETYCNKLDELVDATTLDIDELVDELNDYIAGKVASGDKAALDNLLDYFTEYSTFRPVR